MVLSTKKEFIGMFKNFNLRYFMIGVFATALLKGIMLLSRYQTSTDYRLFELIGAGWLFLLIANAIVILDFFAVWYLIKQNPKGFWIALGSIFLAKTEEIVAYILSLQHLDVLKSSFVERQAKRGKTVEPEVVDNFVSPMSISITVSLMMMFSLIIVLLLVRKRKVLFNYGSVKLNVDI
jgi:hypothetical protein